jgi:hypothetical protein
MTQYDSYSNRSFAASGDLSGLQWRAVDLIGTAGKMGHSLAAGGFGILQNEPRAGEHGTVAIRGISAARAGAAVSIGDLIASAASGWLISVTSGASQNVLGRAVTAAASGMLFDLELNVTRVATG